MKKIAIFGSHGAAKTSLVYKLAAFYKMRDKNVTVIHETARQSPFPINKQAIYKTTLHLVSNQLKKELEADAEGFEIAISDRTLFDAFVYINYLGRGNEYTQHLESFCFKWFEKYDALVYLEPTEGIKIADDGVRAQDVEYQMCIRNDFRILLDRLEKTYGSDLPLIKAESNQIFNEQECQNLMQDINTILYS